VLVTSRTDDGAVRVPVDAGPAVTGRTGAGEGVAVPRVRPRVRPLLLAVLATGLFAAWLADDLGSPYVRRLVSDLVFLVAPGVASVACWRAHRRTASGHTGWLWLAAGMATWTVGALIWAVYELLLGLVAPFPSAADVGFVGYAFFVAVGIARFPRVAGGFLSRWRSLLDGLVIGASLMLMSLIWVLGPITGEVPWTIRESVALAFPVADVTVASLALMRLLVRPRGQRRTWAILGGALLLLAVTDSLYVAAAVGRDFRAGGLVDLGWLVTFALVALAATHATDEQPVPDERADALPPSMAQQLVPYVAIGCAAAAYLSFTDTDHGAHHYLWLLVPYSVLVAVRQVVVVADHTAVARDLGQAVERRTAQLRHQEQWWQDLVQNLSDVVMVVGPGGNVEYCSPSTGTGLGSWPGLVEHVTDVWARVHPDDRTAVRRSMAPVLEGRRRQSFVECRLSRANGVWGWFEVTVVGQLNERALVGAVVTLHDVSERRQLTDRLMHQADHDALTGLPNRLTLMRRIDEMLEQHDADEDVASALLLIDLDDFKVINDSHGHPAGDRVLEVIGRRLEGGVRESDTVARLGGDEFAVVTTGTVDDVRATASRLMRRIVEPVAVGGRRFLVRASIGVVFAGDREHENADALLSHVDIALYEAKARGKGGVVYIEGSEREAAATQVRLREQIAQPDLRQFRIVYQPVVELATRQVRGVEALLRWQHPELGNVPPDEFIPMAEHGGSIQRLGWWVLEAVCRQVADWSRQAPQHRLAVGVNVSIRQLDEPDFAVRVLDLIDQHGIERDQIILEITEQSLARDFENAVEVVAQLRAGGVSVAVDDYGTGYSSLQYLDRFAADVVKIDRSFVSNLAVNGHTQKIVSSVLDMARGLDLQSIAEGIETTEQLEVVLRLGCELGQGYLFSRPVGPDAIGELLGAGPLAVPAPAGSVPVA
jgi:diguanylate cyclase (GGDEF)-like protein/PAS domain S-box-containing protein